MKRINTARFGRSALLGSILLILVISSTMVPPTVSGSGSQAATFDRIVVEASPSVQGYGGIMEVTVTAYFYGGCCYSLFANDIIPQLEVPGGFNVISGPSPEKKGSLTAVAGGDPTTVVFRWSLECMKKGSFQLNVTITTEDCGDRSGSIEVHVIKGATISKPDMFPEDPTTDKDIILDFTSEYPVGNIRIESARVHYLFNDNDLETSDLDLNDGTVQLNGENIGETSTIDCEMIGEGQFRGTIPSMDRSHLYYWIEVLDEAENSTVSSAYHVEVENIGEVEFFNTLSFIFLLVSFSVFLVVIYTLHSIHQRRTDHKQDQDSFNVLGPIGRKRYMTDIEADSANIKKDGNLAYVIVGAIILSALVLIIVMIITGQAAVLFDHLLEGK